MNKFKKGLIMALAVGVLMMGSVFGANNTSDTFVITTTVAGVSQIGIFGTKQTGNSALGTGIAGINISGLGEIAVAETKPYYVAIRTNAKTSFSVVVTSTDFLFDNESGANGVKYNVRFGAEGTEKVGGDFIESGGAIITLTSTTVHGLHVYNYPFAISLTEEQSQSAFVGTYTATMTFNLTTI